MPDTINYRFVMRRALAATWTSLNEILKEGEYGYERDTGKVKIGDGTTEWNDLDYFAGAPGLTISDTAPTSPASGEEWVYAVDGTRYTWYVDPTDDPSAGEGQWVEWGSDTPAYAVPEPTISGDLATEIMADSPRAYYKMNEAAGATTVVDYSGNGYDCPVPASNWTPGFAPLIPTDPTTLYARAFTFLTASHKLGLTVPVNYDFTICFVVQRVGDANAYDNSTFRLIAFGGTGETAATNYQITCPQTTSPGSNTSLYAFWEHSTGVDDIINLGCFVPCDRPTMIHLKKTAASKFLQLYVNGVRWTTTSYTNEPTGGTDATMAMSLGGPCGHGGHWAFFNSALSDARILAHAQAAGLLLK